MLEIIPVSNSCAIKKNINEMLGSNLINVTLVSCKMTTDSSSLKTETQTKTERRSISEHKKMYLDGRRFSNPNQSSLITDLYLVRLAIMSSNQPTAWVSEKSLTPTRHSIAHFGLGVGGRYQPHIGAYVYQSINQSKHNSELIRTSKFERAIGRGSKAGYRNGY